MQRFEKTNRRSDGTSVSAVTSIMCEHATGAGLMEISDGDSWEYLFSCN